MWTRALLKENGKIAFQRNYWTCVLVSLIASVLTGAVAGIYNLNVNTNAASGIVPGDHYQTGGILGNISPAFFMVLLWTMLLTMGLGICFSTLLSNVVMVGSSRYYLENREHKTGIGQLFYAFRGGRYPSTVWVMFLRDVYVFLWSLLFVVPGIVKGYSYRLVPYILAENTRLDRKRIFEMSSTMMQGHKAEAFVLDLSFIGWNFLNAMTFGVLGILYVSPYMQATYAEFYSAIKQEAYGKGLFMAGELPGVSDVIIE